ncbi:heavy metal-associated domain-containing protein, partial [Blyttiomyces helicus]
MPDPPIDVGPARNCALSVKGMTCQSCVSSVTSTVKSLPGVSSAVVDLAGERADVTYDPSLLSPEDIAAAINDSGFEANLELGTTTGKLGSAGSYRVSVKGMTCQ